MQLFLSHRLSRIAILAALVVAFGLVGMHVAPARARSGAVVVIKPFGAALRYEPSSDASVASVASCGEHLSVVGELGGWYRVYSRAQYLWVGGARVADEESGPRPDCSQGYTFEPGDTVVTHVTSGCLSLRRMPSRSAEYYSCVDNGHRYIIGNGPIESEGEDWFEVWSERTGNGWVLAQYLLPDW